VFLSFRRLRSYGEANLLKVGLTGGIASGKSAIGKTFVALGAYLIQADKIAHLLMQPGEAIYQEIVRQFGREILNSDGTVNRSKLAEMAFGSPGKASSRVQELNRIIHPAVLKRQEQWMEEIGRQDSKAVAMVEAALILEAGARKQFDRLIVVTCRPEQRIQRLAERLHLDLDSARKEVERRMAAQFTDEEKITAADYVIENSGPLEESQRQVHEIFAELKRDATSFGD
jgi:dephospho-CoA kinase